MSSEVFVRTAGFNGAYVKCTTTLEKRWEVVDRSGNLTKWPEWENATSEEREQLDAWYSTNSNDICPVEWEVFKRCMRRGWFVVDGEVIKQPTSHIVL